MRLTSLLLFCGLFGFVRPHGRLIEPPSRSTMWRYGFNTPPNYNDHELYCGGYSRQWGTNGGKCGICGDAWDTKPPRANEAGGKFGNGIIVRKYEINQVIKVRVELTANHMGFFEFRICPNNNAKKAASQMCLDKHVLRQANGGGSRYYPGPGSKVFEMHFALPKDLTCRQCVFQWRYVAGNNWGRCKNGTEAVGCGPQEEFRACSDVTITTADGSADDTVNMLVDPEVYVPRDENNEVDYDDYNYNDVEFGLRSEVAVESVVIIVLASLLVTVLFFASLFLYYTIGKVFIQNYVRDKEWDLPSLPSLPSMPKVPALPTIPSPKLPKFSGLHWPLSNVQMKNLPTFLKTTSTAKSAPAKPHQLGSTHPAKRPLPPIISPPQPPPRSKKLATVGRAAGGGQNGQNVNGQVVRPKVPPPAAPAGSANPATLEIGEPTSVTINGVTVGGGANKTESADVTSGPPSTSGGVIVPAKLAMADEDIPDSMQSQHPPPPPSCPPPEFDE